MASETSSAVGAEILKERVFCRKRRPAWLEGGDLSGGIALLGEMESLAAQVASSFADL
jgi:hypothetical protein